GARVFDYDGDGRSDVLLRAGHVNLPATFQFDAHLMVMRSNGETFTLQPQQFQSRVTTPVNAAGPQPSRDSGLVQVVDINGDGLDDLLIFDAGTFNLYTHAGVKPDLLADVTNGSGAKDVLTWSPISDPAVYASGMACAYPQVCFNGRLWVVSMLKSS